MCLRSYGQSVARTKDAFETKQLLQKKGIEQLEMMSQCESQKLLYQYMCVNQSTDPRGVHQKDGKLMLKK